MKNLKFFSSILLLNLFLFEQPLLAQESVNHLISPDSLRGEISDLAIRRAENVQEIQKLLRHETVQQEFGNLVEMERVEVALASLDDQTLARLAAESRKANDQLQAGLSTNWWIVIAVVAGIVVFLGLIAWGLTHPD